MMFPPTETRRLVPIAGWDKTAAAAAARRYGHDTYYTNWRGPMDDEKVRLFDNGGSNVIHAQGCFAAADAGEYAFCDKPLARSGEEAKTMPDAVRKPALNIWCVRVYGGV